MKELRSLTIIVSLLPIFHVTPAKAYTAAGYGLQSCGTWTAARKEPDSAAADAYEGWVMGFFSGVGWEGPQNIDPLNGTDAEGVWAWIDNYCAANPLIKIDEATAAFVTFHPK